MLGLKNTPITNSLVTITGNEGVSQGGKLATMAPSTITGNVYEYASGQYSGPGKLGGSVIVNSTLLAQNDTDASNASTTAAGAHGHADLRVDQQHDHESPATAASTSSTSTAVSTSTTPR